MEMKKIVLSYTPLICIRYSNRYTLYTFEPGDSLYVEAGFLLVLPCYRTITLCIAKDKSSDKDERASTNDLHH